ncbi:MAG: hypothetical protein CSB44_03965 [Gammaproteobacteria bacterium]|nr:MAG: hypothetical protein CSB44_03965 [Gammaproteobacteria bacterium]
MFSLDRPDETNLVDATPVAPEALLGLPTGHRLELIRETNDAGLSRPVRRKVQWLEEFDADNRSVAHYRLWRERGTQPPYRRELGWERFASDDGRLLDREVRITRQQVGEQVH